ncbi:HdeD family acid-resistance protein [Fibrisoma montanum]|uniref:HdeD family acid-resistance protein n=1 Tax=Fibrisoma montanum TaxID=2305895 RepID=A0A418MEM9_9BACT|nr:DUF308 domain-containing protein [Fibrisoma montanum]RIV25262.1 HdeD family acid-resistance protein [Fibrisoma montanum]
MENSVRKSVRRVIRNWWLLLLTGLLLLALGIWIIASPEDSYRSLSILFSVSLTITGLTEVAAAVSHRQSIDGWGWTLAGGLIDLALGLYFLANLDVTMTVLPILLGIWLLFRGVLAIGTSMNLRAYGAPNWGLSLALGIGIIVFAFLIVNNPSFGALNIVVWTGLSLILAGIFRIILSLRLRKLKERLDE